MQRTYEQLFDMFEEKTGRRPSLADSFADLGIDSLTMAELLCELECRFEVQADESVLDLTTVQELCEYVEQRTRSAKLAK